MFTRPVTTIMTKGDQDGGGELGSQRRRVETHTHLGGAIIMAALRAGRESVMSCS
jgi:hypothetical protein